MLNSTKAHHLTRTLGSIEDTRRSFDEKLKAERFTPKNIILEKSILKDGISSEIGGKHYIISAPTTGAISIGLLFRQTPTCWSNWGHSA